MEPLTQYEDSQSPLLTPPFDLMCSIWQTRSVFLSHIAQVKNKTMSIPLTITSEKQGKKKKIVKKSLIDSGAGGNFIDQNYAKAQGFELTLLPEPIWVFNIDGTINKKGTIKHYVDLKLTIHWQKKTTRLLVTGLGKQKIILGFPWLQKHNPDIDWKKGTLKWQNAKKTPKPSMEGIKDQDAHLNSSNTHYLMKKKNFSLDSLNKWKKKMAILKSMPRSPLPNNYISHMTKRRKRYLLKNEFLKSIPNSWTYLTKRRPINSRTTSMDHKIEMKDGFIPKSIKNYNFTPVEQIKLDKFLKENLEKGYIRPSQSPMASPFFFVSKKEEGKLRPCQDYRYINDWTIKNAYPLPLILEIIDKLKGAKYFTKLDVQWGYNNIWIKKGDEWKAAFKTNRGLFEPTVMCVTHLQLSKRWWTRYSMT